MTLVDTSIWIDHFRRPNQELIRLLTNNLVLIHPFVIGEVFLGHVKQRKQVIEAFYLLPVATMASHEEALIMIEQHRLFGQGLGWVAAHLLASCLISRCELLTADRKLKMVHGWFQVIIATALAVLRGVFSSLMSGEGGYLMTAEPSLFLL